MSDTDDSPDRLTPEIGELVPADQHAAYDVHEVIAVLVDDVWKITRSTVCQDLSLAGGDCGGNWQSIYPPGP